MAERVLRSPGVTTREIDLSAPGRIRPQGIPAGIIGTAQKGPAFVPINFATATEFYNIFGATGGIHFGAMAVNEWMRNARSGLFLRVLGVGDGKIAGTNGTNVTDYAGFRVGTKMRDKDRNAASAYDDFETDGGADGLVINPYAGAATADPITLAVAAAGELSYTAVAEIAYVTIIDDGGFLLIDYDGLFITGASQAGDKWAIFISQDSSRSVSGTTIVDGNITLHDFGAEYTGRIQIADITGRSTAEDVVNDIVGLTGSACTIAKISSTIAAFTQSSVGATSTALAVGKASGSSASLLLAVASVNTAGVTAAVGVAPSFTLTFDDNNKPADESTLVLLGCDGARSIGLQWNTSDTTVDVVTATGETGIDISGTAAGDATAAIADSALTTLAGNALYEAAGGASTYVTSDNVITITFGIPDGTAGEVLPTATIVNNNAAAPLGRTYFLGVNMYSTSGEQDYLNKDSGIGNTEKILRGVLMFPSGVLPGIVANGVNVGSSDMPSAAWGTYATGKDQGDSVGLGNLASGRFKMVLNGFSNTSNYNAHLTGSFDPLSPIYFPKVLNTDPTKIQERGHYLYAHYDVPAGLAAHTTATGNYTYLLPGHDHNSSTWATTSSNYKPTFEHWRQKFSHAASPWILSQTLGSGPKKLFKFHMLDAGSGGHGQVKISITNIVKSTDLASDYGRFDVQIRSASDLDSAPIVLQSFAGVNLNPASDRYIGRVVGDQNTFYEFEKNEGKQKLVTEGLYPNNSQHVRVEVMAQVESGQMEATALPIGFQGKNHLVLNGQAVNGLGGNIGLKEPPLPFRSTLHIGSGSKKVVDARYYWGTQYQDVRDTSLRNKETGVVSLVNNLTKHFPNVGEYPAWVGDNRNIAQGTGSADLDADVYNDNYFSLENVWVRCLSGVTTNAVDPTMWHEAVYIRNADSLGRTVAGVTADNASTVTTEAYWFQSAENGTITTTNKNKSGIQGYRYLDIAKDFGQAGSKKFFKFTVPVQGGFDGLDIFDQDKSSMNNLSAFREMSANTSATFGGPDGPSTAAFRKALDILAEKSDVDVQLLATPGMRDAGITDYAIDKTEDRFDALYIMDANSYDHDNYLVTTSAQETSVTNTAQKLLNRNLDTSFAATYFPDLIVQDGDTNVVVPPSVAVMGAMSLNDAVAHPWYAPAGFARGALASTLETAVKLNRPNMDVLYDSDINPITSFPETGNTVVIFGQKTMLQAQSALDRVNVRRLLIDVRRKVRTVANQILFEPNREATLARFSSLVNPILGRIQAQQGIDRYKVIIDTTTTTQQDVENNTIRGKIFLQPTRSIEFISLDFVVTNAGAEI